MKLTKTKSEITENRDIPGLLNCLIKHEIKSTTASAQYSGTKLPPEVWAQVVSFLKWVNDTYHSEGQVRMYMNPKLATWRAWAYPQEARTGMSSRELPDHPQTAEGLIQFKASEGWVLFSTVHSHCDMAAFQSGTDEANEKDQDGLHITVGHLNRKQLDLHFRFYRKGMQFDPDMQDFWDVGETYKSLPDEFVDKDAVARWQMATPAEAEFPEEWKKNLIEIKPVVTSGPNGYWSPGLHVSANDYRGSAFTPAPTTEAKETQPDRELIPEWRRVEQAATEIEAQCAISGFKAEEIVDYMEQLCEEPCDTIIKACLDHDVEVEDVLREFRWMEQGNMANGATETLDQGLGGYEMD